MTKLPLSELEELVTELVLPFYQIERDMYLAVNPRRLENDAEHSWSVTFVACALAPRLDPTLDFGLISQFATIHDMVEVYAGDASTWNKAALAAKAEKEAQAVETIAKRFAHFPWIVETIAAYERQDTNEARYVRAIDKCLALLYRHLDKGRAYVDKKLTKEEFAEGLALQRQKVQVHPAAAALYEEIWKVFDEHPEYFAQSSK